VLDDEDEAPRRGRRKSAVVDVETERNLLLRVLLHSPKDTVAGAVAVTAALAVIGNAAFMQRGHHPAPMFNTPFPAETVRLAPPAASPPPAPAAATASASTVSGPLPRPRPVEAEPKYESRAEPRTEAVPAQRSAAVAAPRPPASVPHNDPVGDLIKSDRRIAAVQRALTEFGYGQLKPTGVAGTDTQAAIQRFERERKLPVTGQVSDRLVRELAVVTGRAID
jgi:type IV secretory pathway VirB10-like protein